jgi:uncharacterized protein (DUF1330 family)
MPDKKPAYVIAEVEVTDMAAMEEYIAKAVPTLGPHKAQFLARSKAVRKEGTAPVGEIVMLRFDSLEEAEAWYHSAEYSAVIPLRQRAANSRLFIIEGEPE